MTDRADERNATRIPHIHDVVDPRLSEPDLTVFREKLSALLQQYLEVSEERTDWLPHNHAFVLGIHGPWGSGKSTLMAGLQATLEESMEDLLVVEFNAWKFNEREALWRALLSRVVSTVEHRFLPEAGSGAAEGREEGEEKRIQQIREYCGVVKETLYDDFILREKGPLQLNWAKLPKTFLALIGAAKDLDLDGLAEKFPELFSQNETEVLHRHLERLDDFLETFTRLQKATQLPWLILIDDLDRCLPESAIDVFEATKVFLDVPGVAFVLAVDKETIRRGLRVRYREKPGEKPLIDADQYIEKVTNVAFTLPTLSSKPTLDSFVKRLLESANRTVAPAGELDDDFPHLLERYSRHIQPNPRRWIRLLNTLFLYQEIWKGIGTEDDTSNKDRKAEFLKLVSLMYRWPGFMEACLNSWSLLDGFERAAEQTDRDFGKFREICTDRFPDHAIHASDPQLFMLLLEEPKLGQKKNQLEPLLRMF